MKKIVAIILLLTSIFTFSSCNSDKQPFVCISDKVADKVFTLNETPFTSEQIDKINTVLDTGKKTRLEIDETGRLYYGNGNIDMSSAQSDIHTTEKQAVQIAEDYLRSMDLLPSDDYAVDVFDLHTIYFRHTYDDIPIFAEDNQEGIYIGFTGEGLGSLDYRWSTVTPVESGSQIRITLSEAKQLYLDFIEEKYEDNPEFGVPSKVPYQQVYYCEDGKSVPCYVFSKSEPFLNPVYINAVTGDITEW